MTNPIRQASPDDIPLLARFEREISELSFGKEAITDLTHHESRLRKAMAQDVRGMFVADCGGVLCGWLWMDLKTNFLTQERYINFRSFYLSYDVRGDALGEALLRHGLAFGKSMGARTVTGKVHCANLPMRALYKKAGFSATHLTMEYTFDD